MSMAGIQRFLYRFDKDEALQNAYETQATYLFDNFDLSAEECEVLRKPDLATLYRWGLHPVLIRNFSGTLKMDIAKAYRDGGLDA